MVNGFCDSFSTIFDFAMPGGMLIICCFVDRVFGTRLKAIYELTRMHEMEIERAGQAPIPYPQIVSGKPI
jgi:hypothetical protein